MSIPLAPRWFDEEWNAQFDTQPWKDTLTFYIEMMNESGLRYLWQRFQQNLLFQTGKCGMWIDATVAASFVTNPMTVRCRQGWLAQPPTMVWASAATAPGLGRWPFPLLADAPEA
jgi:sorbitol/mannitol transport system substrate-binding protein